MTDGHESLGRDALLLGVDIGTSAAKGVLMDTRGTVVRSASREYPVIDLKTPGWSEQDPEEWWRATVEICRELVGSSGSRVIGIGLSGQMHGSVLVGRAGLESGGREARALRPALLWNDQRTEQECREIEEAVGGRRALVQITGNAALTGFTLPKLLWVRRHEPRVFERAAVVLTPKDSVRLRLTGEAAIDVGDAAGTLMLDVAARAWSERVCAAVGIDMGMLPRVVESGAVAGRVTAWCAEQTGLAKGTPVVAGSGDNMMGAVGAGVVGAGDVLATIGTSGVIYAHSALARKDLNGEGGDGGRVQTMCAADGTAARRGEWCLTGCTLSAGGALRWARDLLMPGVSFEAVAAEAGRVRAGSDGLLFLPHLMGERCPYPDPGARGAWIGLTAKHTRAHMMRAVMEGVAFTMGEILEIMRGTGVEVRTVRLGGGGARSELWRQIQADVYGAPVVMTNTEEGPALGAAMLAGVGAGVWGSVREACEGVVRVMEVREPGSEVNRTYSVLRAVHRSMYPKLRETFGVLGRT